MLNPDCVATANTGSLTTSVELEKGAFISKFIAKPYVRRRSDVRKLGHKR
jgi:hypothetical protein